MSDRDDSLVVVDEASTERPLTIPPDLPVLPLRDTVLFPNSFMPLAVARESVSAPDRRGDVRRPDDRRVHPARSGGRGAAAGRSLSDRRRDPHPQDVQAARTAACG